MIVFKEFREGPVRVRVVNDMILGINNYTTEVAKEIDGCTVWYPADELVGELRHPVKTPYTAYAIESFNEVINKLTR